MENTEGLAILIEPDGDSEAAAASLSYGKLRYHGVLVDIDHKSLNRAQHTVYRYTIVKVAGDLLLRRPIIPKQLVPFQVHQHLVRFFQI